MKRSMILLFLTLPLFAAAADVQTRQVKVRLLNISRRPVPGITILVTENGTLSHPTDQNGRALLTVPAGYGSGSNVAIEIAGRSAVQWVIVDHPDSIQIPSSNAAEVTITLMRRGDLAILTNKTAVTGLVKKMVKQLSPSELVRSASGEQKDALINEEAKRLGVPSGELGRVIQLGLRTANSPGEKARLQMVRGHYSDAIRLYDRSVAAEKNELSEQLLERALAKFHVGAFRDSATDYETVLKDRPNDYGIMTDYGFVLIELGRFKDASAMLGRALELVNKNAPNGRTAFLAELNLAYVLRSQYDVTGAKAALDRASAIAAKFAKPVSHEMAWLYNNLAALDDAAGRYDDGFAHFSKARQIFSRVPESGLSPVILTMNIAFNRLLAGDLKMAKLGFDDAKIGLDLLVKNRSIKSDHPIFATLHNYVGGLYDLQYDFPSAADEFEKGRAILRSNDLTTHPKYARALANLAKFYDRSGDTNRAKDAFDEALRIQIAAFGADNVEVANTYSGLGALLARLGDLTQAETDENKAIGILKGRAGFEKYLYSAYANRAAVYLKTDRPQEALSDLIRSCEVARQFKKERPLDYSDSLLNLADQKHGDEAETLAKEAVDVRLGIKGLHPDGHAEGLLRYGLAFARNGKYADAERIWKQALTLVDNRPDRPVKATAMNNLGEIYRRMKSFELSESYLVRALELWHRLGYEGREDMLNTCAHYRQLFIDQKVPQKSFEGCRQ